MPDYPLSHFYANKLAISDRGVLKNRNKQLVTDAVDATITVGDENTNVRAITIQVNDAFGRAINHVEYVEIWVLLNAAGDDFVATGGSTGIAIGASGKLLTVVAKKLFMGITTSAGVIALTWTDTGNEAAYLGVRLPTGRMVISAALTNAP